MNTVSDVTSIAHHSPDEIPPRGLSASSTARGNEVGGGASSSSGSIGGMSLSAPQAGQNSVIPAKSSPISNSSPHSAHVTRIKSQSLSRFIIASASPPFEPQARRDDEQYLNNDTA